MLASNMSNKLEVKQIRKRETFEGFNKIKYSLDLHFKTCKKSLQCMYDSDSM